MEKSKQFQMSPTDWKKRAKSAVVYFAPILLMYISGVLGVLQLPNHHFRVQDLIPSQLVIDGSITWAFMQIQGTIMAWADGK